ncbi:unnamed protein product [Oppiella nova]|uniref:Fe2OG dioxygenase domain-containing protein n=1 Tax=Oppiella nova TaxID=334625 RepID=A0A7R9MM28_9ACAR|nr:unnamed protein product [Oppiella nova]CAG2179014.1 unnamed protein product [Oppiella nova]
MYKSPEIVVIHEFLSECETQTIISSAQPSLQRIYFGRNGKVDAVNSIHKRLAVGSRHLERHNKLMPTISRRICAITGLNMEVTEPSNVANDYYGKALSKYTFRKYSVGGYFEPHFDRFAKLNPNATYVYGRIATWLNYLSDVGAGGATVFPLINVTVWPTKYSALFWHNFDKSGEPDWQTLHSGCPVLVGHKWIATKGIHFMGNEFRKPCNPYDRHSRLYIQ